MGDQIPLITEGYFSTVLHISEPGDEDYKLQSASPQIETPSVEGVEEQEEDVVERIMVPPKVTLSTESPVSRKVGTQQLIPKNLAVMSRPKNRHHTTVVTFPVGLELSKSGTESKSRLSAQGTDVAWDEYDSDGDGFALRKNRRNMSYKAAVTTLDAGATPKDSTNTLQPVVQRRAVSPSPSRSPGRKRTLGRKRNQKQRGSFKDATPQLYQEIRERGLHSNISVIHQVSQRFFEDLERRHYDNLVIRDISDIVQNHAAHHFEPYIVYCANETFQQRTLQRLLATNTAFKETLKQIESSSECGSLPMISFLILPMQRVTRLPLLLDTICQKTPDKTAEYFAALWAFHAMSKLVTSCNERARQMERTEQMYTIQKQMDFGKIKPFPLVSSSRWLKKRGELAISSEELSIWRAFSQRSYYLFLFNDVLIVTKKKSEESFVVMDYAILEKVEVEVPEDVEGKMSPPSKNPLYLSFKLLMSKNTDGKAEQITLVADSRAGRARWIVALTEHKQVGVFICKDGLPQYEATKAYMPKDPDELSLQQAELVILLQKEDGWCYGERMRDGRRGWFPASCATEITDPSAIENNVQRMKRLRKETNV